jgi:hypothetical protein
LEVHPPEFNHHAKKLTISCGQTLADRNFSTNWGMSMSLKICLTTIVLALSASTIFPQPNTAAGASTTVSNPALISVLDNQPARSRGRSRMKDRDPAIVQEIGPRNELTQRSGKRGRNERLSTRQAEPVEAWHVTIGRSRRQ